MRIRGKQPVDKEQRQWFLVTERDKDAKSADDFDVLEEQPLSVTTWRSMEEIASARDRVWNGKGENDKTEAITTRKSTRKRTATEDWSWPNPQRRSLGGPDASTVEAPVNHVNSGVRSALWSDRQSIPKASSRRKLLDFGIGQEVKRSEQLLTPRRCSLAYRLKTG